jgi:hypothetical protein
MPTLAGIRLWHRWLLAAAALLAVGGGAFALGHATSSQHAAPSKAAAPTPGPTAAPALSPTTPSDQPTSAAGSTDAAGPATTGNTAGPPAAEAVVCPGGGTSVSTAGQLTAALAAAGPGSVIHLGEGTYHGRFTISRSATVDRPAWLCGPATAVLDGGEVKSGYGLHLDGVGYWRLAGFSVTDAQKGVVLDGTSHTVVQGLSVYQIGDEGIHLRAASSANLVIGNSVHNTGLRKAKFGEGIYVGSAKSNWCTYSGCQPDHSDYNVVAQNTIAATSSENLDIKEGTRHGKIIGNSFSGAGGLTAADSWVDVKGNDWTITGNRGENSPADGFQTHSVVDGWGTGNVFSGNTAAVDGAGFAIHLAPVLGNVVNCSNTESGARLGLSNVACRH